MTKSNKEITKKYLKLLKQGRETLKCLVFIFPVAQEGPIP